MAESINIISTGNRDEIYRQLIPQIEALTSGEKDLIANLSNIASALKYSLGFFWVGFYLVKKNAGGKEELVLGPFQGPVACTRISFGKGVCGTCWKEKKGILVEDVEKFPGHIACSSESKSEIVLPVFNACKNVAMVLDVDSNRVNDFSDTDLKYLGEIALLIEKWL